MGACSYFLYVEVHDLQDPTVNFELCLGPFHKAYMGGNRFIFNN